MDQAGFQIGAGGSFFDSLLLLEPRFDWLPAKPEQHQFENLSKEKRPCHNGCGRWQPHYRRANLTLTAEWKKLNDDNQVLD